MTRNYRSTPAILEAANKVIAENKDQKHKELWTKTQVGNPVTVRSFMSNQDEARWVRSSVEDYVTGGGKRRECVVLYRTNAQSRALEEEFLTHRIPYTIVGGFRFYERREVKDALALLQWWVNPSSTLALRRLADALWRGIGPKTIAGWELRAEQHDTPLRTLLTQVEIARPVMAPLLGA
ncbi:MAG: hypothetical protein IH987_19120, partial [Planctomycetes bacterium]|nr:hypothetical protein [Planctomycetota bacterium]